MRIENRNGQPFPVPISKIKLRSGGGIDKKAICPFPVKADHKGDTLVKRILVRRVQGIIGVPHDVAASPFIKKACFLTKPKEHLGLANPA